jgi:hypothetical protein
MIAAIAARSAPFTRRSIMKAAILACLALLFMLLLFDNTPALAVDWEHDDLIQAGLELPFLPGHGLIALVVNCTWEKNRCAETKAYLTTPQYTQREIPVTMIVNPQATRAVVTFLDGSGSVITWRAIPGQQQIYDSQQTFRGQIVDEWNMPLRFIYSSTHNYAYITGTILDQTFDTREMPGVQFFVNQIVSRFTRWLDAPDPTTQQPVKR